MLIDGATIVDRKLVTFNEDYPLIDIDDQVQPNGLDLRLNRIYTAQGAVSVHRDKKAAADLRVTELEPKNGWFELLPTGNQLYWVDFLERGNIQDGFAAMLIARSSLVRAGVDVMSGLWDTGWTGPLGCTLRVHSKVRLEWGAKICQILFIQSEFNGLRYDGRYQNKSQAALAE